MKGQEPGSEILQEALAAGAAHWVKEQMALHHAWYWSVTSTSLPKTGILRSPSDSKTAIHHTVEERGPLSEAALQLGLTDAFRHVRAARKSFGMVGLPHAGLSKNRGLRIRPPFWSAKRSKAVSAPAAWIVLLARTSSPAITLLSPSPWADKPCGHTSLSLRRPSQRKACA